MSTAQATGNDAKKRKKNYYIGNQAGAKRAKRSNLLDCGTGLGFLVTINSKQERRATLTAYSLLNEAADRLYGPQEQQNLDKESDGDDIETELKALREENFRFSKLRTEIPSVIFISSKLPKPLEISTDMYTHMPSTVQHIVRLVPVLATCKTQPECVSKKVLEVLEEQHPAVLSKISFFVQLKARHNSEYNSSEARRAFCMELAKKVQEWNCDFVPELKEPELVINIDILQKVCCISLLPHFARFKKYNPEQFNSVQVAKALSNFTSNEGKSKKVNAKNGKEGDDSIEHRNSHTCRVLPNENSTAPETSDCVARDNNEDSDLKKEDGT
ncbi:THUMP domain-containing protein 1-like isoform X1 [Varroa jacobsoni]|uniref:THUMP domain-containing protein n=1 Tax=Varroa destructor TaxID=109461 RepID=A0A7M7L1Q0_VARDE|nr:THUMP domain-containing protein 1-like isoform X1 [Varroa destructor]XP_022692427.1 THUMP domain-containing protein 1-like isoform X1 [Varroa jacobsoni]XP_022692436.1 THUMP domain-containing protein 1-like isoform X1 [Varroa jacobsoni]